MGLSPIISVCPVLFIALNKSKYNLIIWTNHLAWTSQVHKVTSSRISDFEIDGITFEVGGKNKKGKQIKDAEVGYLVKKNAQPFANYA